MESSCYTEVVAATLGEGQLPDTAVAMQGRYFALHTDLMFPFSFSFESLYIAPINHPRGCLPLAVTVIRLYSNNVRLSREATSSDDRDCKRSLINLLRTVLR